MVDVRSGSRGPSALDSSLRSMLARLCAALILVLGPGQAALAQDRYKLTEDDAWTRQEGPDPASPEGQLVRARKLLAQGEFARAEEVAGVWIDRHINHPLLHEAFLIRGDALLRQTEHFKALFDYEAVIRGYPGTESFVTANERELEIARIFAAGTRRKLWGMRIIDATPEAEEIFIRIQERLPGSRLAEEAGMDLSDFYFFKRRDMTMAAESYLLFTQNYPKSPQISKARRRLIYAYLAAFKGPQFDVTGLFEAKSKLHELQEVEPATAQQVGADALLAHIDEADARKMLTTARWYQRTGDVIGAEFTIRRLVKKYPRSVATADALRLIPSILRRLPESLKSKLPDYDAMRAAVLGTPARATTGNEAAPTRSSDRGTSGDSTGGSMSAPNGESNP